MVETTYENNPVIYRATAIVRNMSADERALYEAEKREETLTNEKLARGYEREQGRKERDKEIADNLRKRGFTEEQINSILSETDSMKS